MLLNMVSYVPHLLHLSSLGRGLLVWTHLTDMLDTREEYGFLLLGMILSMNPLLMLSLIAGLIVYVLAYLGAAVFSFYLYIVLELAIVYAVADEGTSAREALTKARKRFSRYVWVQIWTDLTISTGWLFLVPGAVFMAWYSLTPYVFALEGEEQVAFSKKPSLCHRTVTRGYEEASFFRISAGHDYCGRSADHIRPFAFLLDVRDVSLGFQWRESSGHACYLTVHSSGDR